MIGCFGNNAEDLYIENQLTDHLDNEECCTFCGEMKDNCNYSDYICDECMEEECTKE